MMRNKKIKKKRNLLNTLLELQPVITDSPFFIPREYSHIEHCFSPKLHQLLHLSNKHSNGFCNYSNSPALSHSQKMLYNNN